MNLRGVLIGLQVLGLLGIGALAGCSGGGGGTAPVTGKVTFADGSPVAGGTILFSETSRNLSAVGTIAEDGTYRLGTYAEADGAVPGDYKVTVFGTSEYGQASPIDGKFGDAATTPLSATVTQGRNTIHLQVERGT